MAVRDHNTSNKEKQALRGAYWALQGRDLVRMLCVMAIVFIDVCDRQHRSVFEAHFERRGHTIVSALPADVVIIDLDCNRVPGFSGSVLTAVMSVRPEDVWKRVLPVYDIYRQKPVDVWFLIEDIEKDFKNKGI